LLVKDNVKTTNSATKPTQTRDELAVWNAQEAKVTWDWITSLLEGATDSQIRRHSVR
jgi:hypothetical protein